MDQRSVVLVVSVPASNRSRTLFTRIASFEQKKQSFKTVFTLLHSHTIKAAHNSFSISFYG